MDDSNCLGQAARVFGLYIGLLILLIILGAALMYHVSRCCVTHPKAKEEKKELNEKSFLLITP